MKEYHVEYSKRAQKQINKLDRQISDPRIHGKGLTGNHAREWRYRIGDYRLICDIQDDIMIILALEFGHRRSVYNKK